MLFNVDIALPTNNVHVDDLVHSADLVDFVHYADLVDLVHYVDLVLLSEAARNCPNGWVDGTYVGMGN